MERKYEEIIENGKKAGKSYEEINAELKAAGADFSLNPEKATGGWTEKEWEEGFFETEKPLVIDGVLHIMASDGKPIGMDNANGAGIKSPVVKRDVSRAGTVIQAGGWELTYDEDGYCVSKGRIRK